MSNYYEKIKADFMHITNCDLPWEKLEGKSILISGANGMVASYIVETILFLNKNKFKNKCHIFAVSRNKDKAFKRFENYLSDDNLEIIIQDINLPFKLEKKIDFIIHAASQASPVYYSKDPVGTLLPNIIGTYHLLEMARQHKVEGFLFFSTGEIYGEVNTDQIPIKEDSYGYININDLRSCYAESKRMGETMCISWFHQYNIPIKIIRLFHTYGYGLSPNDGRVFADFIFDIVNKRDIIMKSNGETERAFCYLADAVAGFFTVLLKGTPGTAYNIGNDKAVVKIIELANTLVKLFPEFNLKVIKKEDPNENGYLKTRVTSYYPDISRIKKLGWEPKYFIKDGFRRSIESYLL